MVDSSSALAPDARRAERLELRVPTTPTQLPAVRAMAGDLAMRMDYDLDSVEDLRLAVDEACATLVDAADPTSQLLCRFLVRPERIRVHAQVQSAKPDTVLSTDTFGWRVLQTLADEVEVLHEPGSAGRPATVGIRLDKTAGDVPR